MIFTFCPPTFVDCGIYDGRVAGSDANLLVYFEAYLFLKSVEAADCVVKAFPLDFAALNAALSTSDFETAPETFELEEDDDEKPPDGLELEDDELPHPDPLEDLKPPDEGLDDEEEDDDLNEEDEEDREDENPPLLPPR